MSFGSEGQLKLHLILREGATSKEGNRALRSTGPRGNSARQKSVSASPQDATRNPRLPLQHQGPAQALFFVTHPPPTALPFLACQCLSKGLLPASCLILFAAGRLAAHDPTQPAESLACTVPVAACTWQPADLCQAPLPSLHPHLICMACPH